MKFWRVGFRIRNIRLDFKSDPNPDPSVGIHIISQISCKLTCSLWIILVFLGLFVFDLWANTCQMDHMTLVGLAIRKI